MMTAMLILAVLGVGMVIYAIFGVFTSESPKPVLKSRIQFPPLSVQDPGKEQKIQRLQSQVVKLESQLEQVKAVAPEETAGLATIKAKEEEFLIELKRREEWVKKAEAELAKTKTEILDLNKKFMVKENELQEEFAKNVNFTRQLQEMKSALEGKEKTCRLQDDQLQLQKHQSESQLKKNQEQAATIAEFSRKEKISEWVPKTEFNQLNQEYTKLEKELETSQERLKSFAAEIAHLRQSIDKKASLAEEVSSPKIVPEEAVAEESTALEIRNPQEIVLQKTQSIEKNLEENLGKTLEETDK